MFGQEAPAAQEAPAEARQQGASRCSQDVYCDDCDRWLNSQDQYNDAPPPAGSGAPPPAGSGAPPPAVSGASPTSLLAAAPPPDLLQIPTPQATSFRSVRSPGIRVQKPTPVGKPVLVLTECFTDPDPPPLPAQPAPLYPTQAEIDAVESQLIESFSQNRMQKGLSEADISFSRPTLEDLSAMWPPLRPMRRRPTRKRKVDPQAVQPASGWLPKLRKQ